MPKSHEVKTPLIPEQGWMREAAEKMAREGKNLLMVVDEMGIPGMRPPEIEQIRSSKTFQKILREERNRYAMEVGNDPTLQKQTAVGMMAIAINNLMLAGHWDKALEGIQKLAKLAGWQAGDSVSIFTDLKPKDIGAVRDEIFKNMKIAGMKN